jgi:hypothetical protein
MGWGFTETLGRSLLSYFIQSLQRTSTQTPCPPDVDFPSDQTGKCNSLRADTHLFEPGFARIIGSQGILHYETRLTKQLRKTGFQTGIGAPSSTWNLTAWTCATLGKKADRARIVNRFLYRLFGHSKIGSTRADFSSPPGHGNRISESA